MNFLALSIVGLLALGAMLFSKKGYAMQSNPLDEIFNRAGRRYGIDPLLLKAIATVESSLNPKAVNAADNESIGLMQILCRPDGKGGCANRFNVSGWNEITREKLFDPATNVSIGAQILAWNLQTYGYPKGIAVYNAWDQRNALQEGPFKNQAYVDKVTKTFAKLQEEKAP